MCSILTIITGCVMGEICSTYPSAGSVYYWSAQMVTPRWGPLAAYTCGWLNALGNAAGDAAFGFGFANVVAAAWDLQNIDDPSAYTPLDTGAQVGIAILVCFVWAALNGLRTDTQAHANNVALWYQLSSTFVLVITVAVLGAANNPGGAGTNAFVWTTYYNDSGFVETSTVSAAGLKLYVGLLGLLMSLFSFAGYEAAAHAAEETHDSHRSSPYGIIATCGAVAACGVGGGGEGWDGLCVVRGEGGRRRRLRWWRQ